MKSQRLFQLGMASAQQHFVFASQFKHDYTMAVYGHIPAKNLLI
ncbi:hypothetical protein [Lysinibacillus fusiformis]|nr:hypothetical protein [Lysinibacillus fusiformis]MCR8853095.1 hypothetical protein [Lysinibacillus fusiformis]